MNQKTTFIWAGLLGCLGVMVGAFGAHALKPALEAAGRLDTFETAVKYQFYHTLALLAVGLMMNHIPAKALHYASLLFVLGILFFSGSLYILCMTGVGILGAVTPLGGVLFIAGWIMIVVSVVRK
ncbi:DUF423 domain-containing protein [Chryseolinea sp. T2]|uniref:DUF423 domain-containing protein n=1 Tax=Chryseolinea sp. T2 TaxID=3129255 RepID=UPI003077D303